MEVVYDKEVSSPSLTLIVNPSVEGTATMVQMVEVFEKALLLAHVKTQTYGGAWRQQGSVGNLARILSKVARLKNMCWRDTPIEDFEEPVLDNALDLVNLSAFFTINHLAHNRWGWGDNV